MFRRQILAQLKQAYPGVPENVLGLIADKLAKNVTAEDQIQGVVDELENSPISIQDYADFLQREGDRRVTLATRKNPVNPPKPGEAQDDKGDDGQPKSDIEKLTALVTGLATTVNTLVKKDTTKSMQTKLEEALPDVSPLFYKGRIPDKEEDFDNAVEEIKADWAASGLSAGASQTQTQKGKATLKNLKPPVSGVVAVNEEEKVDPDVAAFAKRKAEAAALQQTK